MQLRYTLTIQTIIALTDIAHEPQRDSNSEPRRELLSVIAKARLWPEDLVADQTTIGGSAKLEDRGERYLGSCCPLPLHRQPI
jgi:hypothetical protein